MPSTASRLGDKPAHSELIALPPTDASQKYERNFTIFHLSQSIDEGWVGFESYRLTHGACFSVRPLVASVGLEPPLCDPLSSLARLLALQLRGARFVTLASSLMGQPRTPLDASLGL